RLGLHRVGYQVLHADGRPEPGFEAPAVNLDFWRMPPHPDAVKLAYAADSGITVHGTSGTPCLYGASDRGRGGEAADDSWQPGGVPAGDYIGRAHGEDAAGNAARGATDLPVRVVARGAHRGVWPTLLRTGVALRRCTAFVQACG